MAQGNPLLAAWGSDTLRLFELSEAGFVQRASTAFAHNVNAGPDYPPQFFFPRDSGFVGGVRASTNTVRTATTFTQTLSQISAQSVSGGGAVGAQNGFLTFNPVDNLYISIAQVHPSSTNAVGLVNADGTISAVGSTTLAYANLPLLGAKLRMASMAPDGTIVARGAAVDASTYNDIFVRPVDDTTKYGFLAATRKPYHNLYAWDVHGWSADSRFFLAGTKSPNGFVEINKRYAYDTLTKVGEIRLAGFYPTAIAFSPNTRYVAITWTDGTAVKTVIYRRYGNTFSHAMEVPVFGAINGYVIGWTADGQYLIDAANRKAMKYEGGVFSPADEIMANVPAGIVSMAVSTHVKHVTGRGMLYDGAVSDLVRGRVNLASLKLALLKDGAGFIQSQTSLAAVTANGTLEAWGNGWPLGGKPIPNVRMVETSPSTFSYRGDSIKQVIVDGNLTARYGVIYDDANANKKPLLFIDFQRELFAEKDTEVTLTFDSLGFITYSA